jgi:hypothetical protein
MPSPSRSSASALGGIIFEKLLQGVSEFLFHLAFIESVFMADTEDRFFAELLGPVNTADQRQAAEDYVSGQLDDADGLQPSRPAGHH